MVLIKIIIYNNKSPRRNIAIFIQKLQYCLIQQIFYILFDKKFTNKQISASNRFWQSNKEYRLEAEDFDN